MFTAVLLPQPSSKEREDWGHLESTSTSVQATFSHARFVEVTAFGAAGTFRNAQQAFWHPRPTH